MKKILALAIVAFITFGALAQTADEQDAAKLTAKQATESSEFRVYVKLQTEINTKG